MSIIKDVQTIPTDELQAFEKRLLDKATVARERCNMLTEERNKLREEGAMCDIAIKAFKKRKGYQFGDPIPASAWLDIHAEDNDTTEEEYQAIQRKKQLKELLADNKVEYAKAEAEANAYLDACEQAGYFTHYDINSKAW